MFDERFRSPSSGSRRASEKCVDGAKESLLISLGEFFDFLESAQEAAVFDSPILGGLGEAEKFFG